MQCGVGSLVRGLVLMQLFRYTLIGIASNTIAFFCYLSFVALGAEPKLSMTFVYVSCAMASFWGNRGITFAYGGRLLGAGFRYLLAQLAGYLINLLMLIIFVDNLGCSHQLVQAAAFFIVAAFLFISLKFFVFKGD